MRRRIWWLLGFAAVTVGLVFVGLRIPAVQDLLLGRIVARRMSAAPAGLFADDAVRVLLCGTSSPMPHPTRAKPCVAVFAAGRFWSRCRCTPRRWTSGRSNERHAMRSRGRDPERAQDGGGVEVPARRRCDRLPVEHLSRGDELVARWAGAGISRRPAFSAAPPFAVGTPVVP